MLKSDYSAHILKDLQKFHFDLGKRTPIFNLALTARRSLIWGPTSLRCLYASEHPKRTVSSPLAFAQALLLYGKF